MNKPSNFNHKQRNKGCGCISFIIVIIIFGGISLLGNSNKASNTNNNSGIINVTNSTESQLINSTSVNSQNTTQDVNQNTVVNSTNTVQNQQSNSISQKANNTQSNSNNNTSSANLVAPQNNNDTDNQNEMVYITKTGHKYHSSGCRYLSRSEIPIKLKDAKAEGYTSCEVCHPPQ